MRRLQSPLRPCSTRSRPALPTADQPVRPASNPASASRLPSSGAGAGRLLAGLGVVATALVVVGAGGSRLGRRAALDSGRSISELTRMTVVSPMAIKARIDSTSRWSRARDRVRWGGARWRGGVRCMPETSQPTLMPR